MTEAQRSAATRLCNDYHVPFTDVTWDHPFDLPEGWVAGWVGPIYAGISPTGEVHT